MANLHVRALRMKYDKIIDSNLDPFDFAVKLLSAEIISSETYKLVTDKASGMTGSERLRILLDSLTASITLNEKIFDTVIRFLKEIGGASCLALSKQLESTHQGKFHIVEYWLHIFLALLSDINPRPDSSQNLIAGQSVAGM